jgi:hypothetical protein
VNRRAADPCLNAKPSAGHHAAKQCGNVRPADAEAGTQQNRKWNAIGRAGMGVERHRNEHDHIAEKNR